ncbi:MAG: ATP-binding protein [Candidatus Marinimicrobia bacterium]|nr:ATP-binding protein [Candidatus Neomarinimicrobiota bacterium]
MKQVSINRKIQKHLLHWKEDKKHKVLLLRGARQVGKTYSIRELGKTFPHYIEINLDENPDIHYLFEGQLNPQKIYSTLSVLSSVPIIPGKTLIFFDEIQACPNAIRSLRYFYEQFPDLHVVAAGSLLEFVLSEIPSFGVGRISSMYLFPLTFEEFLTAIHSKLIPVIRNANSDYPIEDILHNQLLEYYRIYQLIGGMPEVIAAYLGEKDLLKCMTILDNLISSLQDDFAKYKKRSPVALLREVFQSTAIQAGGKFVFKNGSAFTTGKSVKTSLELLNQAGLIYKIPHTSANGLPLGAEVNWKKFKVIPFDSGIYQRLLGFSLKDYFTTETALLNNAGSLAEVAAGLQLMYCQNPFIRPELYYWHREAKNSNAEVDFVIQLGSDIVPIEVKAGTKGQMQSIQLFMDKRKLKRGIRTSLENFSHYGKIDVIPLYAIGMLNQNEK